MTKAHAAGINRLLALVSGQQTDLLAAGDDSGGLIVWDTRTQAAAYTYSKHTDYISGLVQHAALAGGGSSSKQQHQDALLAVSGDGTLSVHDLRAGKVIARSESDADDELLSGMSGPHKKGRILTAGQDCGGRRGQARTHKGGQQHTHPFFCVAWVWLQTLALVTTPTHCFSAFMTCVTPSLPLFCCCCCTLPQPKHPNPQLLW